MRNKAKQSTLWNSEAFASGISKIEFNYNSDKAGFSNSDALKIEFGVDNTFASHTAYLSTEKGVTKYTITPDTNTYTFVRMCDNISYSLYFDSIVIYLA